VRLLTKNIKKVLISISVNIILVFEATAWPLFNWASEIFHALLTYLLTYLLLLSVEFTCRLFIFFCSLQSRGRHWPEPGFGFGSGNVLPAHRLPWVQEQCSSRPMSLLQCKGPQAF